MNGPFKKPRFMVRRIDRERDVCKQDVYSLKSVFVHFANSKLKFLEEPRKKEKLISR